MTDFHVGKKMSGEIGCSCSSSCVVYSFEFRDGARFSSNSGDYALDQPLLVGSSVEVFPQGGVEVYLLLHRFLTRNRKIPLLKVIVSTRSCG